MSIIKTADTSKQFSTTCAVDSHSLEVQSGGIFVALGPNGASRTTTLPIGLDILKPDSGTIKESGNPHSQKKDRLLGQLARDPSYGVTRFEVTVRAPDDVFITMLGKDLKRP